MVDICLALSCVDLLPTVDVLHTVLAGLRGWQCVPGQRLALRRDPSGPLQCYSSDMRGCSPVCKAEGPAGPIVPASLGGALTCGPVLQVVSGQSLKEQAAPEHWCNLKLPTDAKA